MADRDDTAPRERLSPEQLEALLPSLLYGELDAEQASAARVALDARPELAARLNGYARAREALRDAWPDEDPPAAASAQLLRAAAEQGPAATRGAWRWLTDLLAPALGHPALAAVASLAVVGGVVGFLSLRGGAELAQPRWSGSEPGRNEAASAPPPEGPAEPRRDEAELRDLGREAPTSGLGLRPPPATQEAGPADRGPEAKREAAPAPQAPAVDARSSRRQPASSKGASKRPADLGSAADAAKADTDDADESSRVEGGAAGDVMRGVEPSRDAPAARAAPVAEEADGTTTTELHARARAAARAADCKLAASLVARIRGDDAAYYRDRVLSDAALRDACPTLFPRKGP